MAEVGESLPSSIPFLHLLVLASIKEKVLDLDLPLVLPATVTLKLCYKELLLSSVYYREENKVHLTKLLNLAYMFDIRHFK